MADLAKTFYLLVLVFLVLGWLFNFNSNLPKLPGDIFINRPGLKIYIPFTSVIIISVLLTLLFNFFRK